MTEPLGALHSGYDRISIPTIWVAVALSLVFHAVGLFGWIPRPIVPFQEAKLGQPSGTLAIRLVPFTRPPVGGPTAPAPEPERALRPAAPPAPAVPARRAAPRKPAVAKPSPVSPAPPVIALNTPSASSIVVAPPAEAPKPAQGEDLAAYIAARRRAREGPSASPPAAEAAKPAESEQERHNRTVAENLGLTSTPTFGNDPDRGGGVFQIRSMGYDIGEFAFFGWNQAIKRNSLQVVEVRRGNNANMEIAVVRRMISIIRERSSGDFLWQSRRLGRGVWLSARPADTAELEAFVLKELFPDPRPR
ncbi:MAG: hypothetical protein ABI630_02375 [Betaproteobacteria bacterium]